MLNEDGTPKVFYHGTASKFFEFDKNMGGINTNAQSAKKAFFFTSSQKVAGGYAEDATNQGTVLCVDELTQIRGRFSD